ncbi:MAG: hypothetical protein HPY62_10710 [Bacteroidales bacterium]|nr:hypothetical protein [Bacteroidales bacterium]
MMKTALKILFIIPVLYLVGLPVFMTVKGKKTPCSDIVITIKDSADYGFVSKRDILNIISGTAGRVTGRQVGDIPVNEIETNLYRLRELKSADVFTTVDGVLHVVADQREPIMRVRGGDGVDYYVDEEGIVFRKRTIQSPRLHLVSGNIVISRKMMEGVSVLDTAIKRTILRDIYYLVSYIRSDGFWSAQIDQIYVDGNDEIDLIPRAGNHTVHLGTAENFVEKLRNLRVFYEEVLPEVGWNKYSVINLAFRDQIVCKRR